MTYKHLDVAKKMISVYHNKHKYIWIVRSISKLAPQ